MPARFQLKKARNGKVFFNLLASNGEIILTSQMYASRASARKGIASVQTNAALDDRFEARADKSGKSFFVLKAGNRQVIGTGEAYASAAALKNGMKSVSSNAPKATIEDLC